MLAQYGYVGLLLVLAILFTLSFPLIAFVLNLIVNGPRKANKVKTSTYECGMETWGRSRVQFNIRFYLYALVFVAFDVLTVFLYPWAVGLRDSKFVVGMLVFVMIVGVAYIYAWSKKALEWK